MIRLPAEWEPQSAIIIAWPHSSGDFESLPEVENSYQFIAETISRFQPLIIVCKDHIHQHHIDSLLNNKRIHYIQADYNDIWVRDTLFLTIEINNQPALLNFRFNGWGNKYPHDGDNALNPTLLKNRIFNNLPVMNIDFVLEGGSIDSDGQGTLITTSNCLLNPNRNPEYDRNDIHQLLCKKLGGRYIHWIEQDNLAGDDTDAHIDTLVRFCSVNTLAYSACNDPEDEHYASLKKLATQLQSFRTPTNQSYKLVELPLPAPIFDKTGLRLPANYANFLIINGAILVPVYNDPMDSIALARLALCFPDREVIACPCLPLIHQFGSLHCMTMNFPATLSLNL